MRIQPSFPWLKWNPGYFNLHILTPFSIYYNTQYVVLGTLCCSPQRLISWNIKCWLQFVFFESHITAKNVSSLITWYETKIHCIFNLCLCKVCSHSGIPLLLFLTIQPKKRRQLFDQQVRNHSKASKYERRRKKTEVKQVTLPIIWINVPLLLCRRLDTCREAMCYKT